MNRTFKQLAYVSQASGTLTKADLAALMRHARRRNKELGITGLLLVDPPTFLQIIEGPADAVEALMADIEADPRHHDIEVIHVDGHCPEREFGQWLMGCRILGDGRAEDLEALDERVRNVLRASRPNGTHAHDLLLRFRELEKRHFDV